jgi:hypothetical protein
MQLRMQKEIPTLTHEAESFFEYSSSHLWTTWGILGVMIVAFTVISVILLRNVARDSR